MAIAYYYPEGPLGPICDYITDDDLRRGCSTDADCPPGYICVDGRCVPLGDGRSSTYGPVDYGDIERITGGGVPALTTRRCRVRTLADGTEEYYDCVDDFLTPIGPPVGYPLIEPEYDWPRFSADPWGLDDDFEPVKMGPYDCAPFEPDINIIPLKMYRPDGTFVEKILTERSSPPTFPVRSGVSTIESGNVGADFVMVNADNLWYTNPATLAWRITDSTNTQITNSVLKKGGWVQVGASNNPGNGWTQHMIDYGIYPAVPLDTEEDPYIGQWQSHTTTVSFATSGTYNIRIESDNDGYIKITNSAAIDILDREIYYNPTLGWGEETISLTLAAGVYTVETRVKNRIIDGGDLKLRVTGDAAGLVGLKFKWNDNPSTAGTALSSVVVDGVTFNQTGRSGETDGILTVNNGVDYPITINPGTGYGGKEVQNKDIGFYDLDGQDWNATLSIVRFEPEPQVTNVNGYWSEEGNEYAVWTNPEVCTLPTIPQEVTYTIDIPADDTYTFTGGADYNWQVFLNDSNTPIITGDGGIFESGALSTPYSVQQSLTAGELKMVVVCTNDDGGFVDADGDPEGDAFRWDRNPGGWYLKICRGSSCVTPSTVEWVPSGPHSSWGDFADTYLVYPSSNLVLKGTVHTTSYNINVPFPGNYTLEYAVDDAGTISLDGTQIVSSTYNAPSSATYTISNLTAGPHVITVTCENQTQMQDSDDWTRNPAGIGWTLTPQASASNIAARFKNNGDLLVTGEGFGEVPLTFTSVAATATGVDWTIAGNSSDSGYQIASPTKIMWDDDIGGGFDENASLTISSITQIGTSNVGVTFSSDGTGIDITGAGSADVVFDFAWNDQVSISGRAVGTLILLGQTFTQTSNTSGSQTATIRVNGSTSAVSYYIGGESFIQTTSAVSTTKTIEVEGGGAQGRTYSSSSFYTDNIRTENDGQRLCLNDNSGSNEYMSFMRNVQINRTGGFTEYNDLGFEDTTNTANYFYPIVRAIAEEYTSGRFGRTGTFPNRGRAPDESGMTYWVLSYLNSGGSLTDAVDPTLFDGLKFLIFTAYANNPLGSEGDLGDIVSVVYPQRCTAHLDIGTINQGVATNAIIASSLDLRPFIKGGNLIWTTRDATGYTYKEVT